MRQALTMDVLATDLADYLVRKGVCFGILGCTSTDCYVTPRFHSEKRTIYPVVLLPSQSPENAS